MTVAVAVADNVNAHVNAHVNATLLWKRSISGRDLKCRALSWLSPGFSWLGLDWSERP